MEDIDQRPVLAFAERFRRLAAERGQSPSRFALDVCQPDVKGVGLESVKKAISERQPSRLIIEATVAVTGGDPFEFPEYSLLLLRDSLDPGRRGLAAAMEAARLLLAADPREADERLADAGRVALAYAARSPIEDAEATRQVMRREAEALREEAQRESERREAAPGTKPAARRRRDVGE